MKIIEAINEADTLKPNVLPQTQKVKWLERLDQRVKHDVFDTHVYNAGETEPETPAYSIEHTDAELLVPEPYAEMYIHWLTAQIDYANLEYDGFNAANAMFNSVYASFCNAYNRSHMPKGTQKTYF